MMVRERVAWVTGASSGMGAASAIALAEAGFTVALTARRRSELDAVAATIAATGGRALVFAADVADKDAIDDVVAEIERRYGAVDLALFGAGLNVRERHWSTLSMADFDDIVKVNLTSLVAGARRVLPAMRGRQSGQIIALSSWAAWRFSPGAGIGYAASKAALVAVVETLNAQEGSHGIRACHLCPGDVDTPFLDRRPVAVDMTARGKMLTSDDVARAVQFIAESPASVCINELVISPTANLAYGNG